MGLAASNARLLFAYLRKQDIELRGQNINAERSLLGAQATDLSEFYADALGDGDPDNDAAACTNYEAQAAVLSNQDKMLEMEQKNIEVERSEADTEIDALKKVLDKNIERSFKTFGG